MKPMYEITISDSSITYEIRTTDAERTRRAATILRTLASVPILTTGAENWPKPVCRWPRSPSAPVAGVGTELAQPDSLTGGGESSSPPLEQKRRQPGTKQTAAQPNGARQQ